MPSSYRPPDPFRAHVEASDGGAVVVRPAGELDIETVGELQAALTRVRDAGHKDILLDLSALDFMDSTGLRLVIEWDAAARSDGFSFAVRPGDGPVLRLLQLSGMHERLRLSEG